MNDLVHVSTLEQGFQRFISGDAVPEICEQLALPPEQFASYVKKRQKELDNGHFRNQAVQLARCERLFRELWDMLDDVPPGTEDPKVAKAIAILREADVSAKLSLIAGMRELIKLENTILYDSRPMGDQDAKLGDVVDLGKVDDVLRKNREQRENAKRSQTTPTEQ